MRLLTLLHPASKNINHNRDTMSTTTSQSLFLIKIGEIKLKEGNRKYFLTKLKENILSKFRNEAEAKIAIHDNRMFLTVHDMWEQYAQQVLSTTPGINGWALAQKISSDFESISQAAIHTAKNFPSGTFKIEARRSDKSYPLTSYEIACEIGSAILDTRADLSVNLSDPDTTLFIEIREDAAYLYTNPVKSLRGLPTGTAGKGLLLLSGGIDSPVAGYLMSLRGLALEAVHFAAYPYTSQEAWDKVSRLANVLARYTGSITLHTIQFTDVQLAIKKQAPQECVTIYLRAAMVEAAHILALTIGCNSIITGESLSQVASQTAENMRFTAFPTDLPVLRPLIGMDKEDTIRIARSIGTFDISIEPYEDCCVLFSPKHPVLKAKFEKERASYKRMNLTPLIEAAVAKEEIHTFNY